MKQGLPVRTTLKKIKTQLADRVLNLENILARKGLVPGHQNFQKFVILCNVRTGSTFLYTLLNRNSDVRCFFELFHHHEKHIAFDIPGYETKKNNAGLVAFRNSDPVGFLNECVWCVAPKRVKAVGFKLLYTCGWKEGQWLDEAPFDLWWENGSLKKWNYERSDLWPFLIEDKNLKIIHLTRENLLRQHISIASAVKSGKWGDAATGGYDHGVDSLRLSIDPDRLKRLFVAEEEIEKRMNRLFQGHEILLTCSLKTKPF